MKMQKNFNFPSTFPIVVLCWTYSGYKEKRKDVILHKKLLTFYHHEKHQKSAVPFMYSSGETELPTFQYICSSGGRLKSFVLQALKCIVVHEGSFARLLEAQSFSLHHLYISYGQRLYRPVAGLSLSVLAIPSLDHFRFWFRSSCSSVSLHFSCQLSFHLLSFIPWKLSS